MPRKKQEENKKSKTPSSKVKTLHKPKATYYQAVGRRKTATARVKLQVGGKGQITINQKPVEEYFPGEVAKIAYLEPLQATNNSNRFDVFVKVEGSGKFGQLGAVIHGLSRALEKVDREKHRPILKKRGFLTRDSRAKERRKPGLAQKARKKKQSPKR